MVYTVQSGDTLFSIAKSHNTTVEELKRLNNLSSNLLKEGQQLHIAEAPRSTEKKAIRHTVKAGESFYVIAKKYNLTVTQLKHLNPFVSSNLRSGQSLIVGYHEEEESKSENIEITQHFVKPGETIESIAQYYNLTVLELLEINDLSSQDLTIGQKLRLKPDKKKDTEELDPKNPDKNEFHLVLSGESVYMVAKKYKLTVRELKEWNNLNTDILSPGQQLRIKPPLIEDIPESIIPLDKTVGQGRYHIVKRGETIYTIARKYKLTANYLQDLNNLTSLLLTVGQKLLISEEEHKEELAEVFLDEEIISDDVEELQTIDEQNLPGLMKSIIEARKIFLLESINGADTFGAGIRGAVGRNHVNRPDDLEKIQIRLIQLKMLSPYHQEATDQINQKTGGGPITANLIPKTIEAIERFQNTFKVKFWIENSTRIAMMKTNSFTSGVVIPGDITYKVLRDYTQYTISFPHPTTEQQVSFKFHNFPVSVNTQYYHGVFYLGNSNPEIPLDVFRRLGLGNDLALALKYITRNEGNFDAISSYDDSIFSWGFIHFSGNGGGLANLLASIKHKAPKIFHEFFQKFGIDVDFNLAGNSIRNAQIIVVNPYDKGGKYLLKGIEAERLLRADKHLYGVFIRAGHHLPIITLQIDAAIKNYIRPALNIRMNINAGSLHLSNVPVTDYFNSPMGLALLIDLTVNQWTNNTRDILKTALEKVILQNQVFTVEDLSNIDERLVIKQVMNDAENRNDNRLIFRINNILNSGLSWRKS